MLSPIASSEKIHFVPKYNCFLNEVQKDRLMILSESGDRVPLPLCEIYYHKVVTSRLKLMNLLKYCKMKSFRKLSKNCLKNGFACLTFFPTQVLPILFWFETVLSLVII